MAELPSTGSRTTSPPALTDAYAKSSISTSTSSSSSISSHKLSSSKGGRRPLMSISKNTMGLGSESNKRPKVTVANSSASNEQRQPVAPVQDEDIQLLQYPTEIPLPSRDIVRTMYETAIQNADDQVHLDGTGLLSLEQVILPAVYASEDVALQQLQAVVQRDCPQHTDAVEATRWALYEFVGAGCDAVVQSREARAKHDADREAQWQREREEAAQRRQRQIETRAQQHAAAVEEAKQAKKWELQKKLPANQELWREIAFLTKELTELSTIERQWEIAAEKLTVQEAALAEQEGEAMAEAEAKRSVMDDHAGEQILAPVEQIVKLVETATDITVAAQRIQGALQIVNQTVVDCEQARSELCEQYKIEQMFHGYQRDGIKEIVRFFSQSQPDDDTNEL